MMNINCSLNCFFQNDGKCTLTHIRTASSTPHPECLHYIDKATAYAMTVQQAYIPKQ
ncbi:hydroxymyristoyl-ACP dehydratase [Geosporobacter ferrireducens]|uniref:hydroxymyristoyl-ACP dehydratase n=1 Tax=Geosporobacter ferrireducens TaxID=1424294 RepID=UPI0012EAC413|nr:hydroxymyristoyl-ACP dehydratase [Geosporobacter ferrireducens]MTI54494.1 hydroxymyristoyl-ACP dehydratase [Geosporobacter ferrireducens]